MAKEQTVSQVLQIGQANEEMKRRKDAQQGLTGRRTGSALPLTRGKRARRLCICRAEERRHSKRSAFPPKRFRPQLGTQEKARTAAIASFHQGVPSATARTSEI